MNTKKTLLPAIALFLLINVNAQYMYQTMFGVPDDDHCYGLVKTTSGIVTGGYSFNTTSDQDISLYQVDEMGYAGASVMHINGVHGYNNQNIDKIFDISPCKDGGIIMVGGASDSVSMINEDLILVKWNSSSVSWAKQIGEAGVGIGIDERGFDVTQTSDDGFVITGMRFHQGLLQRDAFVVKADKNGIPQWNKLFGFTNNGGGEAVIEDHLGRIVVTGYGDANVFGGKELFLYRFNATGGVNNIMYYGFANDDIGEDVIQTDDGGYLIVGSSGINTTNSNILLIKTFESMAPEWIAQYDGPNAVQDNGTSVIQTIDGNYVIAGYTFDGNASGAIDGLLMKVDQGGKVLWSYLYGNNNKEEFHDLINADDGGFIVSGFTSDAFSGKRDVYTVKTDYKGTSGCLQKPITMKSTINNAPTGATGGNKTSVANMPLIDWQYIENPAGIDHDTTLCSNTQPVPAFAGNDTSICSSEPVQLGEDPTSVTPFTPTFIYHWKPGKYLNDSTIADPIATPDTSIKYIVYSSIESHFLIFFPRITVSFSYWCNEVLCQTQ